MAESGATRNEWPAGSWSATFAALLRLKGLEPQSIAHDPAHGWTILLEDGREFERSTTTGVRAYIEDLEALNA